MEGTLDGKKKRERGNVDVTKKKERHVDGKVEVKKEKCCGDGEEKEKERERMTER